MELFEFHNSLRAHIDTRINALGASIFANHTETKTRLLKMSKELDDLTAAVAKISTAINTAVTDIQNLNANGDAPGVEAAAQQLSTLADQLTAAVTPPTDQPAA